MTLSPEQRRALALLSAAGESGCTEHALIGHGFTLDMLAVLIRLGLAAVWSERILVGRTTVVVARMGITQAGREALSD
jgi:hypothetical protein